MFTERRCDDTGTVGKFCEPGSLKSLARVQLDDLYNSNVSPLCYEAGEQLSQLSFKVS